MPGEPQLFCWGARLVNIQKGLPPLSHAGQSQGRAAEKHEGGQRHAAFRAGLASGSVGV